MKDPDFRLGMEWGKMRINGELNLEFLNRIMTELGSDIRMYPFVCSDKKENWIQNKTALDCSKLRLSLGIVRCTALHLWSCIKNQSEFNIKILSQNTTLNLEQYLLSLKGIICILHTCLGLKSWNFWKNSDFVEWYNQRKKDAHCKILENACFNEVLSWFNENTALQLDQRRKLAESDDSGLDESDLSDDSKVSDRTDFEIKKMDALNKKWYTCSKLANYARKKRWKGWEFCDEIQREFLRTKRLTEQLVRKFQSAIDKCTNHRVLFKKGMIWKREDWHNRKKRSEGLTRRNRIKRKAKRVAKSSHTKNLFAAFMSKERGIDFAKLEEIPEDNMVDLDFDLSPSGIAERTVRTVKVLSDGGSTFNAINEKLALEWVAASANHLEIARGRRFLVDNGSGKETEYDGRYIQIPVKYHTNSHYHDCRFYINPVALKFDLILGQKDMKKIGFRTFVELDYDEKEEVKMERGLYDLDPVRDARVVEQLDQDYNNQHILATPSERKEEEVKSENDGVLDNDDLKLIGDWSGFGMEEISSKVKQQIVDACSDLYARHGLTYALKLKEILSKYYVCLSEHKWDFGKLDGFEYSVKLKKLIDPIWRRPYPMDKEAMNTMKIMLNELESFGVIGKYKGPWGCAAFMVRNNDGSMRLVCDFSPINKHVEDLSYPCPDINEVLLDFNGKRIKTSVDITKAFHNIQSCGRFSQHLTAFTTPFGTYIWKCMPFGGKTAPATWAWASDQALMGLKDVIKYIDDIAIASVNIDEHMIALRSHFSND